MDPENFSGILCIDELHLGHRTLLLATDPLGDFPVAFALVSSNDKEHMRPVSCSISATTAFCPKSSSPTARTSIPTCWRKSGPPPAINFASSTSLRTSTNMSWIPERDAPQTTPPRALTKAQTRTRTLRQNQEGTGLLHLEASPFDRQPSRASHRQATASARPNVRLPAGTAHVATIRAQCLPFVRSQTDSASPLSGAAFVKTPEYLADPDLAQALRC